MKKLAILLSIISTIIIFCSGCSKQQEIYFAFFFSDTFSGQTESSHLIMLNAISRYEKDHPNVKINYTTGVIREDYLDHVNNMMMKGKSPDVMLLYSEDMESYARLQALQPLDGYSVDMGNYYKCAVESVTYEGRIYGLPFQISPTVMAVNMDILNAAGISEISPEWTTEELLETSKKIEEAGYLPICNYTEENIIDTFPEDSESSYDELLKETKAENYLTMLNLIYDTNLVSVEDFKEGKVAFMPMKYSEYILYHRPPYNIKNYVDFDLQCLTMPGDPQNTICSTTDNTLISMSRYAKNKEVAYDFMCYLSQDLEVQTDIFRYSGGVSAVKGMTRKVEIRNIYDTYLLKNDMNQELEIIEYMLENSRAK